MDGKEMANLSDRKMPWKMLHHVRKSARDGQANQVTEVLAQVTALQKKIGQIAMCLAEMGTDSRPAKDARCHSAANLLQLHSYRQHLLKNQKILQQEERRALAELESQRALLLKAQQDVRMVDHLCNNQLLENTRQQAAQEVRASDELDSYRSRRMV